MSENYNKRYVTYQVYIFIYRPADIPEILWLEEGNDLILSCAQLSSVLGIQKSFSTSDITQLPSGKINGAESGVINLSTAFADSESLLNSNQLRPAISELALNSLQRCGYMLGSRLDHASRSCSTWVAVGELASTSQLPSPHGGPILSSSAALNVNSSSSQQQLTVCCGSGGGSGIFGSSGSGNYPGATASSSSQQQIQSQPFTAADLIRSVNKKVRQNYIRRRLLTTYRAIERLSQSEFNLDQLEAAAVAATVKAGPGPTELIVPTVLAKPQNTVSSSVTLNIQTADTNASSASTNENISNEIPNTTEGYTRGSANLNDSTENDSNEKEATGSIQLLAKHKSMIAPVICPQLKNKISMNINNRNLTIHDIEKERGRPLSKYDRNMMIFNWLHSLDETSTVEEYNMM